ncbi:MAG: alpha-ribazole phosphatase [Clostridia bacterium]|nr:alpha-ribazole phosphatase [Clostridia bacterium]
MDVFLVRHGETTWNRSGRYQGHRDVPLSPEGQRQAERLAARLRCLAFDAVLSSDLRRAVDTAAPVATAVGVPVEMVPELREMNFGAWEGFTFREVERRFPESARAYREDAADARPPGGETLREVQARAVRALAERWRPTWRRVLVVTHGATIKALVCHYLGLDLSFRRSFVIDNASITTLWLQREAPARLVRLNDVGHLWPDGG